MTDSIKAELFDALSSQCDADNCINCGCDLDSWLSPQDGLTAIAPIVERLEQENERLVDESVKEFNDCENQLAERDAELAVLQARLDAICQRFSNYEDPATPEQLPARFDELNHRRILAEQENELLTDACKQLGIENAALQAQIITLRTLLNEREQEPR